MHFILILHNNKDDNMNHGQVDEDNRVILIERDL